MLRLRKYNTNDVVYCSLGALVRFGVEVKSENAVDLFLIVFFCFDYMITSVILPTRAILSHNLDLKKNIY